MRQVAAALEPLAGDQADEAQDGAHPLLLGLAACLPVGHAGDRRPGGRNAAIGIAIRRSQLALARGRAAGKVDA